MSPSNGALRVPQYTALWLTILGLALFQLGMVAGESVSVLDAGRPLTRSVLLGAVWAFVGASAFRLLLPGLRRPVITEPEG